ncbi:hypothetical protein [Kamptonema formosum]|uniref:hypothetical protein n=1 Tax=Kamptonema formosum TaxID=331992 RepID=UPI0012DD6880|nr:hypothetical protein [Oscillatoria sp. PCC 10802]
MYQYPQKLAKIGYIRKSEAGSRLLGHHRTDVLHSHERSDSPENSRQHRLMGVKSSCVSLRV